MFDINTVISELFKKGYSVTNIKDIADVINTNAVDNIVAGLLEQKRKEDEQKRINQNNVNYEKKIAELNKKIDLLRVYEREHNIRNHDRSASPWLRDGEGGVMLPDHIFISGDGFSGPEVRADRITGEPTDRVTDNDIEFQRMWDYLEKNREHTVPDDISETDVNDEMNGPAFTDIKARTDQAKEQAKKAKEKAKSKQDLFEESLVRSAQTPVVPIFNTAVPSENGTATTPMKSDELNALKKKPAKKVVKTSTKKAIKKPVKKAVKKVSKKTT